jgi:hypothetical protein
MIFLGGGVNAKDLALKSPPYEVLQDQPGDIAGLGGEA